MAMRQFVPVYFLTVMVLLCALFIPRDRLRRLFPAALTAGLFAEILSILIFSKTIRLFTYVDQGPFNIKGFPILILFGWVFLTELYLHWRPDVNGTWPLLVYTFSFAVLLLLLHELVENAGIFVDIFKYFDVVDLAGNFVRLLLAHWLERSGFFGKTLADGCGEG